MLKLQKWSRKNSHRNHRTTRTFVVRLWDGSHHTSTRWKRSVKRRTEDHHIFALKGPHIFGHEKCESASQNWRQCWCFFFFDITDVNLIGWVPEGLPLIREVLIQLRERVRKIKHIYGRTTCYRNRHPQ